MFVDSHAHLEMEQFNADREQMLARARETGVETIVAIGSGTGPGSLDCGIQLAAQHEFIYATIGIHPHEAKLANDADFAELARLAQRPKVIAWGEIGLDYHYDNSPRDVQREAFRKQLRMARERELPAVIHTREAEADTLAILNEEWKDSGIAGVIHCFTGTRSFAEAAVELGFYISFSGVVTFKNAGELRETACALPVDKILIETDSPFLAPVPYRGRRNEPAFVVETARAIAELRDTTAEEIRQATSANFMRLFKIGSGHVD